jgi:hypothetical protein
MKQLLLTWRLWRMPSRLLHIAEVLEEQAEALRLASSLRAQGHNIEVAAELAKQALALREVAAHIALARSEEQR